MARSMKDAGQAFRTRISTSTWERFEGPYATVGSAKSRKTWAERMYPAAVVTVEQTTTNWEPVA